tara:strand:+ start:75336 stop:75953 length:618 start_codon:yes stop_codon:yes gene_type:complete
MNNFDISLLIPVFNCELYVERAIRSALQNKILSNNLEIVVVDDCSTDQTSEILKKFSRKVKIIKHSKNLGLPSALNTGILQSSGQFIVRLDADDFILPEYTFILSSFLKRNKYIDAVKCDYYIVDKLENITTLENSEKKPIGCGIMFRREQLIEIGLYDPNYRLHEDKELVERFTKKYNITRIPIPLYKYFFHGENMTMNHNKIF